MEAEKQYSHTDTEILEHIVDDFVKDIEDKIFIKKSQLADEFYANTEDESHLYFRKRAKIELEYYLTILEKIRPNNEPKMKIIKQGKIVKKEYKKTCKSCKTKFIYDDNDTKVDRDGKYVNCPTCEEFIAVS